MSQRFIQRAAGIFAISFLLAPAAPASADEIEAPKSVAEELLEILRAAGTIDETQYRELRERARAEDEQRIDAAVEAAVEQATEAAKLAAAKAAPATESDPEDWKFRWDNSFRLQRNDGVFQLKFGGRIQSDWAVIDSSDEIDDNFSGGDGHGTEIRRARLFFSGTLYERLIFKAQYDFANTGDGDTDLEDAYIGLKDLGPLGTVIVGHFKEPFSLEGQTSSKYITFMERALPTAFFPGRNTGFMANNSVMEKRLLWQVAATEETNDSGFNFDDESRWNVTARLVGVPLYENDGERVVHLGFGYSHRFRNHFMERYRQRPEAHLANYLADTGRTIPTENIDVINPEFAVVWGPASLQAEYMHSFVQGDGTEDTSFWGI
jgi:phosphate-selective porin OprO/OprP